MTLSEFLATQITWLKLNRIPRYTAETRRAVADFIAWHAQDPDIVSLTPESISDYASLDDSWTRQENAQRLRMLQRRYVQAMREKEPLVIPAVEDQPAVEPLPQFPDAPGPTSQPDMALNYLAHLYTISNPRLRSKHSRSLMRAAVMRYQEYLGREGRLNDFSDVQLVAYANYRRTMGRSERTIERELSKLSTLWRYAGRRGWCPTVHFSVRKCAPPTPTAWSPEEMEKIFKAAAEYRSTCGGLPANLVLLAATRLAYDTGERRNAIFEVHWKDIDLSRRYVTYRGETRKGGVRAADNVQRFTRKTRNVLNELREHVKLLGKENERVFPQLHITAIYGHLKLVLKSCGLDSGRNCMFHKIRRTHATHLYLLGGDATQSLGHESDAMTRGYYLDPKYTRTSFLADALGIGGLFARLWRPVRRLLGLI